MYKQLFFDDQRLFGRENTKRVLGKPELIAVYSDKDFGATIESTYVFKCDDGLYRMLYMGKVQDAPGQSLFLLKSKDAIHFEREDVTDRLELENRVSENEIMKLPIDEIAYIVEDKRNLPLERYKMLLTSCYSDELKMVDTVWTSNDLIHWTKLENISWHNRGTEPCTGVFYNDFRKCYTIMTRPSWGIRRVGYVETKDFRNFTDFEPAMQCDSLDAPLDEIYGMPAFNYDGWYIGLPYMYGGLKSATIAKFSGGTMKAQLAYSFEGRAWQRTLREFFVDGEADEVIKKAGVAYKMVWPSYIIRKDGYILLYAAATVSEHGFAFRGDSRADILVFKIREDGFIALASNNKNEASTVITREHAWLGGDLRVNVSCEEATLAVYESAKEASGSGEGKPVPGFTHGDCIPFSGDSTSWIPTFNNGRTLDEFKGRTVIFEIKFANGSLYSLSGNAVPLMNIEAARYREYGELPICPSLYSE